MEKKLTLQDKTFKLYIPYEDIEKAIDQVASRMNADFGNSTDSNPPIILCTLNGAVMYASELLKRLTFPLEFKAIKLTSYQGTQSTGQVRAELPPSIANFKGRTVIVVEDIVDTGKTIVKLKELLEELEADRIYVTALLLKPDVYDKDVKLDYVAMSIPNRFIVGFGLDYNELGRNTKDIYVLDR